MSWQAVTLTILVVAVAGSQAAPHHQQVLYYNHLIPAQPGHSASVVVVPNNVAGIQQYAASGVPLPVGGQYVLVQPGASPVLYVTRAEGGDSSGSGSGNKPEAPGTGEGGGSYVDNFVNFVFGFVPSNPFGSGTTTTPKPAKEDPEKKPEKVQESQGSSEQQQSASLETLDEDDPKVVPVVPNPGQRFVVIGQPQFFGNYDALRNQAVQQNLGTGGAVSSFLLLKNQEVTPLAAGENVPGASALEFQRYINNVKLQQQQQQVNVDDSASVTVDAVKTRPHYTKDTDESGEDSEDIEANPPGPSVAQVKPQAIALAGPGGVAAAAPIGTSVVGPGGLAVAAPHATAVAGPSGGAGPGAAHPSSALSSPAAYKAYLLEQQAKGAYPAGSFHVAYSA